MEHHFKVIIRYVIINKSINVNNMYDMYIISFKIHFI